MRGGSSPWRAVATHPSTRPLTENLACDTLIVGAGITGALLAERLTRQGLDTVIVDREHPGRGSTAASTSMLLWEIDRPLVELAAIYGFERAARAYRASLEAVTGLIALVRQHDLPGTLRTRRSLYLAAGSSANELLDEHKLRRRAELPGEFLDHARLLDGYGMARAGAIISPGAADADPLQLAHGLLRLATRRGARQFDAEAVAFDPASAAVTVGLENGCEIAAKAVVLATGYAMPDIVHSEIQTVSSSWAIATTPQPQNVWKDGALIWELAKDYLYARTTPDGRIIIGGEDSEEIVAPDARDRLIPRKSRRLIRRLTALWPFAETEIDYRWAGTFDTTRDGLPLIGPVPGAKGVYAAYGYGGNGITFSYLAAQLIGNLIAGGTSPLLDDFALDRDAGMAAH
ncbi:NAD(P)/FAD-dependent oxidoreductase [Bradyrhizobium genosp. L]|uniref:NAD(P)/FAD-dependent oxidoreductase n=1 Tax=Bradyrhizobium genosp. L TaxID=83637 RepID=UPI001FEE91AF|nr:FAD-dependent oxidoreductase [Bradyrhizobium genosp. L]